VQFELPVVHKGVIPKASAFISGPRDLPTASGPREIPGSALKTAALAMKPVKKPEDSNRTLLRNLRRVNPDAGE
jgi:hypothetical protein